MICAERKGKAAAVAARVEALGMAARLLSLAGLRPDEDAKALVVATAPRGAAESEAGPCPRRSFCAYCLCAADDAALLAGRDEDFRELAHYFLERLPRAPRWWRGRLDRAVRGGGT